MQRVCYQIVVIGAGANGSHFIRGLCQDLSTHIQAAEKNFDYYRFSYDLTIVDGDLVEAKNLANQLFDSEDVGQYKVTSLAERYGRHYNLEVKRVTSYVKDQAMLEKLFAPLPTGKRTQVIPVLIGMLDNNRTRQLLDEFFYSDFLETLVYIDAGVEGVLMKKNKNSLTKEEVRSLKQSGFGGQVVCGLKFDSQVILEPVAGVFPNIWEEDDEHSHFPGEGCGELIHDAPQRCATNKFAAQIANGAVNNLLHSNSVYTHVINFNAQTGCSGGRDTFISDEMLGCFTSVMQGGQAKEAEAEQLCI